MSYLVLLLAVKILLTLGVIWVYGTQPTQKLNALSGQWGDSAMTYRLIAVVVTALLLADALALIDALSGQFNTGILLIGALSNGGAALVVLAWSFHPRLRVPAYAFGTVAVGFTLALIFPQLALMPLLG
ncbi:MAG: hypothetical protein MK160_07615 [Rhodobacteraceae bacterium]|nr:hypothetical protein [Paracoccaceae bacterium]